MLFKLGLPKLIKIFELGLVVIFRLARLVGEIVVLLMWSLILMLLLLLLLLLKQVL